MSKGFSKSSPDVSAVSAYTGNSVDFTLFELHSNVYKNLTSPVKPNKLIMQATNIIKEYTSFLRAFIIPPTGSIETANLQFNEKYKQENESFFKLIHGIIRANTSIPDKNKAQEIIDQSKIIMTVIDSILLNKIINEKNKPDTQDKTFSSVNPQSIENLVMNSISTDTKSASNISSLISSISDYVNTPDMIRTTSGTTSGTTSIFDTFTPLIDKINTSIAEAAEAAEADTVLTLLNKIVILSVMTIPELKKEIKEKLQTIIKNGFFVVGGNIQCSNEPAFTNSDFTHMHFLNTNPFAGKESLITAPLTPKKLSELTDMICNPSPKHIYIVGNLYCVNGQLIPPNLDDIIGMYDNDQNITLVDNEITKLLTDDNPRIQDIRKTLKISGFCSSLESVAPSHVLPTYLSHTASSFTKIPDQLRPESKPEETKRLEKAAETKAAETKAEETKQKKEDKELLENVEKSTTYEAKGIAKQATEAKVIAYKNAVAKKKRIGFGSTTTRGGNKYTRKNNLVTNNSKTRKNYYDEYESDDKSVNEANESMPE